MSDETRCQKCGAEQVILEDLYFHFSCNSLLGKTSGNFKQSEKCRIRTLERENRILRGLLKGAWVDYDTLPYQMATPEYDRLKSGSLEPDRDILEPDTGTIRLWQLTDASIDAAVEEGKSPK